MQIFQWMLKKSAQEPPKMVTSSTLKKCEEGEKMKSKNIVVLVDSSGKRKHVKGVEKSKVKCENLILFRFIQRKDVSKPFFYHTLNLKGLGSFGRSRNSDNHQTKKSKEVIAGGNKVLPIADSSSLSSSRSSSHDSDNKDKRRTSRKTSGSKMKELLKWSAAAKGLSLKKGAASMAAADGEYESPKISFRWETTTTTSTMTISAVIRALKDDEVECEDTSNSTPNHGLQVGDAGIGNWITTDSEFVVLEL